MKSKSLKFWIIITILLSVGLGVYGFTLKVKESNSTSSQSKGNDIAIALPVPTSKPASDTHKFEGHINGNTYINEKYGFSFSVNKDEVIVECPANSSQTWSGIWPITGHIPNGVTVKDGVTYWGCDSEGPTRETPVSEAKLSNAHEEDLKYLFNYLTDLSQYETGSWVKTSKVKFQNFPAFEIQGHYLFKNPYSPDETKPDFITLDKTKLLIESEKTIYSISKQFLNRNFKIQK